MGANNETLSIIAMRVCNENRSPVAIYGGDSAPNSNRLAGMIGDDFPAIHARRIVPLFALHTAMPEMI
jgi:hypothetical protein